MANFSGWQFQHSLTGTSVALGMVLASTTPSRAVEFWNGSASTDWFSVGNVSAIVPDNTTSTRIDTVTPNATVVGAAGAQSTGLRVGVSATGALTIQTGGTVNNTLGIIGDNAGSTGTAIVDGAGSSWTNSNDFYVGHNGNGTLTVRNGGTLSNVVGFVGRSSTSTSTATVDGAGSTWTNGGNLYVGYFGAGTLTIRNGAAVSASALFIANQAGSTGTLNIGAAIGQAAAAPGTLSAASVNLGSGNGQLVFNHTSANYTFAPLITGSGAGTRAVLVAAGTTILTATR